MEDSKSASEKALQEIGEIEDIILEAFDNTTKARGTLGEAKRNADEALQKALQAEELAKNASSNAENIKNDADLLYKNATNLNGEADLMAGRVEATEASLKTLLHETKSNDTLIHQAKDKVSIGGGKRDRFKWRF